MLGLGLKSLLRWAQHLAAPCLPCILNQKARAFKHFFFLIYKFLPFWWYIWG